MRTGTIPEISVKAIRRLLNFFGIILQNVMRTPVITAFFLLSAENQNKLNELLGLSPGAILADPINNRGRVCLRGGNYRLLPDSATIDKTLFYDSNAQSILGFIIALNRKS